MKCAHCFTEPAPGPVSRTTSPCIGRDKNHGLLQCLNATHQLCIIVLRATGQALLRRGECHDLLTCLLVAISAPALRRCCGSRPQHRVQSRLRLTAVQLARWIVLRCVLNEHYYYYYYYHYHYHYHYYYYYILLLVCYYYYYFAAATTTTTTAAPPPTPAPSPTTTTSGTFTTTTTTSANDNNHFEYGYYVVIATTTTTTTTTTTSTNLSTTSTTAAGVATATSTITTWRFMGSCKWGYKPPNGL